MNTHTIILKCKGCLMQEIADPRSLIVSELKKGSVEYFGRNGLRLYSNPKALMESLKGKFFIQVSFRHLLKLDCVHAFAVIGEALRLGLVKKVRRSGDGLEVVLP